jgi:small-conductance mechanosensitive channel
MIDWAVVKANTLVYLIKVVVAVVILIGGFVVVRIANRVMKKVEEKTVARTKTKIDDLIFQQAKKGVRLVIYGVAIILAGRALGFNVFPLVTAALVVLFAKPFAEIVNVLMRKIEEDYVRRTKSKADDVVFPLVNKAITYAIYVFAVIIALDQLGIKVLPFVAGLGIAGLAIGFAAKDTIANVIAGIFIIIDQPFVLGDRIEVWNAPKNSATWGDVIEIGLRTTKIRTTDNIVIVIPNSEIAKRDIINYTALSSQIRVRIPVGISYGADMKKAEEILLKIAKETEGVSEKPAPKVVVKNFGESSVDLELRVWIDDAKERRRISSEIETKIKKEFDRSGVEIPYPVRHVIFEEKK